MLSVINMYMQSSFKRTWSAKDLIISFGTAALGAVITFATSGWFSAVGVLVLIVGLCLIPCMRNSYRKDGVAYRKAEINLPRDLKHQVLEFLSGSSDTLDLPAKEGLGGTLLEVYYSRNKKAFAQVFEYADFSFAPQSEMVELTAKQAEKLLPYLK